MIFFVYFSTMKIWDRKIFNENDFWLNYTK